VKSNTTDPATLNRAQIRAALEASQLCSRIRRLLANRITALEESLNNPISSEQDKVNISKQLLAIMEPLDQMVDKAVQRSALRGAPTPEDPAVPSAHDVMQELTLGKSHPK